MYKELNYNNYKTKKKKKNYLDLWFSQSVFWYDVETRNYKQFSSFDALWECIEDDDYCDGIYIIK